ncbi:MAG: hypothetical protein IJO15_08850 [Clostridia bacterium]|nr:hypothetical protein [Clostridia bacterium]
MERREQMTAEDQERIYQNAMLLIEGKLYGEAADEFARIPDYRDAALKKLECEEKKATARLDDIYEEGDRAAANRNVRSQEKAIRIFERIPGYRDADQRIEQAKRAIQEIIQKERLDREEAIRAAEEKEQQRKARVRRIVWIAVAAVLVAAACFAGVFLYNKYAVPELRYRRGVEQMEAGAYDEAYRTLHGMNYKDSSDYIFRIGKERIQGAQVGSTVFFGAYPQGRITSQEKDPIEWLVLDRDGSKVMLISKYVLDALPYMRFSFDREHTPVTWKTCLLRQWLNSSFVETAFDPGEVRMLERTKVKKADGSSDTVDRVYVLSVQEAEHYFATDEDRKCIATQFALDFGAYRSSVGHTCLWWLRTPVYSDGDSLQLADESYITYRVACVGTSGQIVSVGHGVLNRGYGVRPVVWVDTEATGELIFKK